MNFDWTDLAFSSKKPLNQLHAIFIAAPRETSSARFKQLIKTYLPQANIVLGLAKEEYVLGLENQPQFKMLRAETVKPAADRMNVAGAKHKIYTLSYFQREIKFLLEKLTFKKVLFINGSWQYSFHHRPEYHVLASRRLDYALLSPFTAELEAKAYAQHILSPEPPLTGDFNEAGMMQRAALIASYSFDHTYQTGVALGRKVGSRYRLLAQAHNCIVPYQSYAMHFGSVRERNFSPANDLNHYDAVHSEVELLTKAQKENIDLRGTKLFINLLPCPTCSRMLSRTDIAGIVYRDDHSDGYALKMLTLAGKKVTRIVQ